MSVDEPTRKRLKAALDRHARHEMKWGADVVHQIEPSAVKHLRVWSAHLDTLLEERYIRRVTRAAAPDTTEHEPETAGEIDPWTLEVDVPLDFEDGNHEVDIAGTEHVKTCPMCHGETKTRCPECGGEGSKGYRRTCFTCHGTGLATCDACDGQGRLVELRVVEVLRRHQRASHVDRDTPVPTDALEKATRDELLHLDAPRVDTATYDATTAAYRGRGPSADPSFEQAMREMIAEAEVNRSGRSPASWTKSTQVEEHDGTEVPARALNPSAHVVRQRLVVRHVPVAEVDYDWRGDPGKFWLVGTEERIHGEDMPLRGAFVSRAFSAAQKRFGGLLGKIGRKL